MEMKAFVTGLFRVNLISVLVFAAGVVGATLVVAQGRHKACPYRANPGWSLWLA